MIPRTRKKRDCLSLKFCHPWSGMVVYHPLLLIGFLRCIVLTKMSVLVFIKSTFLGWKVSFWAFIFWNCLIFYHWNLNRILFIWFCMHTVMSVWTQTVFGISRCLFPLSFYPLIGQKNRKYLLGIKKCFQWYFEHRRHFLDSVSYNRKIFPTRL